MPEAQEIHFGEVEGFGRCFGGVLCQNPHLSVSTHSHAGLPLFFFFLSFWEECSFYQLLVILSLGLLIF